jgi:hypothetical protein
MHGIVPATTGVDISSASDASFSVAEQLQVIDGRLRGFERFAVGQEAYEEGGDLYRELNL